MWIENAIFEAHVACGSMERHDHLCAVFPRSARKNRTPTEIKYSGSRAGVPSGPRAAEGKNADRVSRDIECCA